jgi:hypothetical protein
MAPLVIPRNFHLRGRRRLASADAFLVSIPKSGRTWLRFMLRHYLCESAGIPFSIDPAESETPATSRLACSHDVWEHLTAPRLRDRMSGKYLIPRHVRRSCKVILAVRDLRDVMVSLHLHLSRRGFRSGARYAGDLSEMIRDTRFGARRAVQIQNAWLDEWRDQDRICVFGYEECLKDPFSSMCKVLRFLGVRQVDEDLLERSIDFSSFDNMRDMEVEGRFDRKLLRPADPSDPESFKVRRGLAGGYVDYLSEADAEFVQRAAAKLRL